MGCFELLSTIFVKKSQGDYRKENGKIHQGKPERMIFVEKLV